MKIVRLDKHYWPRGGYRHWCPGCGYGHEIDTEQPNSLGAKWTFDGNMEAPTFTPSGNIRWGKYAGGADPNYDHGQSGVCHYTIAAGKIQYHGDCTHALQGQTVDLPEIPDGKYETSKRLMASQ
jgi:hypothetical protein